MVLRPFHLLMACAMALAVALPTFADEGEKAGEVEVEIVVAGDYWIGTSLDELSPILKTQLGLKHGIAVEQVVPDSPADKAGLQQFDIVTKVGDKEVKSPSDMIEVVTKSEGELAFTIVRAGKEQSIKITPQKRPAQFRLSAPREPEDVAKARSAFENTMRRWMAKGEHKSLEFDALGPAVVMRAERLSFPDDVKVTIEKEGDKPASIVVKRGSKSWEVTEEKLDELPEELRPGVRALLSGGFHPGMNVLGLRLNSPMPPLPPTAEDLGPKLEEASRQAMKRIEEHLKAVTSQLEELKAQIENK